MGEMPRGGGSPQAAVPRRLGMCRTRVLATAWLVAATGFTTCLPARAVAGRVDSSTSHPDFIAPFPEATAVAESPVARVAAPPVRPAAGGAPLPVSTKDHGSAGVDP